MNKSSRKSAFDFKRSVFTALLFVIAAATLSLAPIIYQSRAQETQTLSVTPGSSNAPKRASDPKFVYPESKKVDHVDDYFGVKVADPYRWLEDERSAETKAWVDAQNRLTFGYLDKIPYREKLKARLMQLRNYPRISAP